MLRVRFCFHLALLLVCIMLATGVFAQKPAVKAIGNDTLTFEETGSGVSNGEAAFASSVSGLKFQFHESRAAIDVAPAGPSAGKPIHVSLAGGNQTPHMAPVGQLPGIVSYFPSPDTRTWRTNLRTWSGLRYEAVYPGIDLVYYGNRGQLEYDFIVAPQRDPEQIALQIADAQHIAIGADGGLSISGAGTSLRFSKPVIYQVARDGSRELLAGRYVVKGEDKIGFDIPKWDRSRELIIDPVLVWSSFEGASFSDTFTAAAIDSTSNVYLVGRTSGLLLVQKMSADGKTQVYRAVLGSAYNATAQDVRVDSTGVAYIVGFSGPGFPTTAGAFLGSVTGGNHAFVAVLNPAGTALTYATYLAGTTTAGDQANGVAIDSKDKIYVTGFTDSLTFPTTTGVFQTKNLNGTQTAFVSKIDPTLSGAASLVYSTYLSGPTQQSLENGIGVDSTGNAYVAGNAGSDFPVTTGAFAYDGESVGQGGVYVTKLNPTATALVYSAYLGVGTATGITVDSTGDTYLTGSVGVEDFPTTTGAYQVDFPGGFATELSAAGSALVYSTFLSGPSETITPTDIAIEPACVSACDAYITGYTGADDLPLTNPIQGFNASFANGGFGGNDAFVTVLNGTGTAAVLSTYIGGSSDDSTTNTSHSPAIAANATGDAFVVGATSSVDFPVTLTTTTQKSSYALRISTTTAAATAVVFPTTLAFSTTQPVTVPGTPLTVALRNMGNSAMPITSITPAPADYTETNTCGTSLAAGSECIITVTFKPTVSGSRPGTLTIVQGGNNSPNTVTLTGTGVNAAFLTLTPTTLVFPDQSVDTASPFQVVTVGNTGNTALTLGTTAFSISANFAQANNCPASLASNATCTMNIAFLPTQAGAFSGTMSVSSNTNGLATTSISLSGTGFIGTPALTLSSAGLVFNAQVIGTTSTAQTVSVVNTSNTQVTIFGTSASGDYAVTGCVQALSPGQACSVRVTFTPTATGARAGVVTLADSTPAGTHTFTTTGTGLAQTATLSIDPPALLFADTGIGATSGSLTIQVTNTGDAPVNITRVSPTGDFRISSTSCVQNLRAASVCTISVEFVPTAVGARTGTIVLEDAATGSPQSVTLSGKGLATAAAATETPDSFNFGTQAVGTTTPNINTVTLTNTGNVPFDASNVTFTGANAGDFQTPFNDCTANIVQPGRTCFVQITFTPTAAGTRNAMLTFTNLAGTQTATLTGTGVAETLSLGLTPAALTFQPQQKSVASPSQILWLRNTGTGAVTIASIVAGSTNYQVSGCVGTVIQPNTSCQVNVTLTPTVTTTDNSTLTITSNATGSPQVVNLTGSGAAALAPMQLNPAGLAYNNQVINTASTAQFVSVLNTSGAAVTGIAVATAGTNAADFTVSSNSCTGTLAIASECSFEVTFKPAAAGARTAAANVTDSAGTQTVNLAGFAVASSTSALLVDSALIFPNETIGQASPSQSITFQNTSNTAFAITSVVLGGTNKGDFAITSEGCPITPTLFNPFTSCTIQVNFTPTAAGARAATVTITDAAPGSPRVITLSGKGVAAALALETNPSTITFPPTVNTTTSNISPSVLISNTGTSPVNIASIVLGGTNPGDFAIGNSCSTGAGTTLPAGPFGNTCTVSVSFTPTAAGARSAKITITDNAPGSPTTINISGTGVTQTQTLSVSPTTLEFDPQVTGTTSAQQNLTVTNTGNFVVTFTNVTITTGYALSNECTGQIPPGSTCSIGVTFTPTAAGAKPGTVTITSNAKPGTQTVPLSGTGITTAQEIQLSQTTVVFDPQTVSTLSSPQIVYYSNQGNVPVTIATIVQADTEFSTSGSSCVNGTQVSPQSFCTLRITITPSATGPRTSTLTITDNAPGSPRKITLNGTGITGTVPEVNLTPTSLTFATQAEGTTSAAQNVNLTNNGSGPLAISSVAITGADLSDFAQTNNCVSPLAAGFSCNIAVTFSPTAVGTRTASVTVTDSATGSPHSVSLTGTGKAGALPVVTLTPPSLAYPNVVLNTTSKQTVTVKNTGTANLTITNIAVTGTVPSDFAQTNTCTGAIATNGTCTITVSFTPSTFEDQTGTVTITDNAGNSPQTVPITGNGAEPAVDLSPSSLVFATQKVGTTSTAQTITVENYGNATLTLTNVAVTGPFIISANTCGTSLTAGSTCTISVEFKPTVTGAATGDLVLTDNAGDSPQMAALSGTGD